MADKPRAALVRLSPLAPEAVDGTWDAGSTTPAGAFTLSGSNKIATTAAGLGWRGIRGAQPMRAGSWYFELRPTHAAQSNSRAAVVSANYVLNSGDVTGAGSSQIIAVAQNTGASSFGRHGLYAFAGSIGAITTTDRLCVHMDFSTRVARVRKNGGAWVVLTTDLESADGWCPAALESGNSPVRGWQLYTGLPGSAWAYTPPADAQGYTGIAWNPRYIWTSSHAMPAAIAPSANTEVYPGRIARARDIEVNRRVTCWPWGGSTQSDRGQLVLVATGGQIDHWRGYNWRGARIEIRRGLAGDALGSYADWSVGYIDRLELDREHAVLVLADPLAAADAAFQRRLFPDDFANPQARGRPRPVTIGKPRYCTGVLADVLEVGTNALAQIYHDGFRDHATAGALESVTTAYDKGDAFDPPPTDWAYYPSAGPRIGIKLVNKPAGRVVADPVGPTVSGVTWDRVRNVVYMLWARTVGGWNSAVAPSLGSLDAIEAEAPYRLAAYIDSPATGLALIRDCLDSFCGWLAPRRAGDLAAGRLIDPAGDKDAIVALHKGNVIGTPRVTRDLARGLTTGMLGARNHTVHSPGDLVTSVPTSLREQLTSEHLISHRYFGGVHPDYAHAESAPAKTTWLQELADVHAELTRVIHLFSSPRNFIDLTAVLDSGIVDTIEPGDVVTLTWPRFGFAETKLLVIGVRSRFFSNTVELTLWG